MVFMKVPQGYKEWLTEARPEILKRRHVFDFLKGENVGDKYIHESKKSLYGLRQSARSWYNTISLWLENNRLQVSDADQCLFLNKGVILFAWADDILCSWVLERTS